MATGVNVKMGVSGVSQFKQSMKDAQNSVKTLDQQLKLNEAQFRQTGDAETYMQQKTELLQRQIEEQKGVVEQAEKALEAMRTQGVSPTSQSFQQMQQQMLRAQTDLTNMQTDLQNVGEAGEDVTNNISSMNANLRRVGEGVTFQNVKEGLDAMTGWIEGAIRKAWNLGEAIVKNTLAVGSWADELLTESAQYGVSVEELQRMHKTATLIDTDAESILAARDKMVKNIKKGNADAMGAVAAMNEAIDPRNFTQSKESIEDLFWMTGEWIASLEDSGDQEMYSMALFGKSWRDLLPLFKSGRQEYEETMNSWSVLEEDQVKKLGEMDDQYQKMTAEWETFKAEILSTFAGPMTEGMKTITDLFRELNAYLDTPEGQAMLAQISETISGLITDLTQIDPAEVVAGLKSVIDGITDALKWIAEHPDDIVNAMKTILAGWAVLKVSGGVLTILELVAGLKWLKLNPNITIPGLGTGSGENATTPTVVPANSAQQPGAQPSAGTGGGFFAWLSERMPQIGASSFMWGMFEEVKRRGEEYRQKHGLDEMSPEEQQRFTLKSWGMTEDEAEDMLKALDEYDFNQQAEKENSQRALFGGTPTNYQPTDEQMARAQLEMAMKMERMEETAEETSRNTRKAADNAVTHDDIQILTSMPAEVRQAVIEGMSGVTIVIDSGAVDAIGARVGGNMGNNVLSLLN